MPEDLKIPCSIGQFKRDIKRISGILDFHTAIMKTVLIHNHSTSPRWIEMVNSAMITRRVAPSWLLQISYPTTVNGIIVFVNSQPSVLLNFKFKKRPQRDVTSGRQNDTIT